MNATLSGPTEAALIAGLFDSGRIVDLLLVLMFAEAVALIVYRLRSGRGIAPAGVISNLLAGGFLLLALRAALTEAGWPVLAGCLLAALIAHLSDLALRWPR